LSSTQMDFSLNINRKQNTTSWPEGDITQLTHQDQNHYQQRKSAIEEYFSTERSVEEISSNHQLPSSDCLEELARRCLMLHEDGQLWGFRALVPDVGVVDHAEPAVSAPVEREDTTRAELPGARPEPQPVARETLEAEEENTAERPAVILTDLTELPRTPVAEAARSNGKKAKKAKAPLPANQANGVTDLTETPAEDQASAEATQPGTPEKASEQEEFPAVETVQEEEVAQEEFPTAENVAEAASEEEVEQEDFPPMAEIATETAQEEEVEQEDFPPMAEIATETAQEEEVEQEDFPATAESATETAQEELEQEPETESEPTAKLGDPGTQEEEAEQGEFPAEVEQEPETESEPTAKLGDAPAGDLAEKEEAEQVERASPVDEVEDKEEAEAADEQDEATETDTAKVARIEAEKRLDRVAATDTIIVPAIMLEALEQAERELLAQTETVETSAVASEAREAAEAKRQDVAMSEDAPTVAATREPAEVQGTDAGTEGKSGSLAGDEAIVGIPTQTLEELRRNSKQLAMAKGKTPTQSLTGESRYQITGSQVALRHSVRRRWEKQGRQQKHRRWVKIVSAAVIVSILVILLIPLCVGLVGYNAYTNIKGVASDGISHLMAIKDLVPANKNDIMSVLNTQKLTQANTELSKAESDFLQLQDMVNRPDIESLLQQWAPQYSGKLDMARRLVQVALDVSRMGQELIGVAQMGANIVHSGSLLSSSSNKPLLTANDISSVEAALVHGQYYINDISTQMSQVNLAQVPFGTASQKAQIAKYLQLLPQAQSTITQVQSLIGPVSWLLGIGQARHFLVQTLDRGELRPSGGFEGQYGVLTLQNGRMSPFTLKDITGLDYGGNGAELGATPPPQYGWMNFGFFGVRDANLSADYPTTAQIVMNYFQREGGGPVDGDIQITPVVIEQLLQITGPLHVAEYNETITAQNLEQKLHAYQQDPRLIAEQQQKTGTDTHSTRKAFTNLVGSLLLDRAKHMQIPQLLSFGKLILQDLKSRDVQVYFTNPVAEQWLTQNGYSGAMPKFTNGTDGFMVVQANISISKAAQYVHTTFNDQVTLDANGGATHNLTITLNYQQTGPVYGYNSYADYLRVYAPANAQFISGYGFNSGQTLCTPNGPKTPTTSGTGSNNGGKGNKPGGGSGTAGSYIDAGMVISGCANYWHSYPDTQNRYCPDGNYQLGYDGMAARAWPIQALGAPTQKGSDLPGYQMWGGMTLTPKNCISTITLSWYVPHVVQNTAGQPPYQMIVGHQAGWPDTAQVSIDASALKGVKSFKYNHTIDVDTLIALPARPLPPSQQPATPTPAVTPSATPKKP
jgi:hypothetical protein